MKPEELIKLYCYVAKLKQLKRAGWVRKNVSQPESVADHSFSLALLAMLIAGKRNLNVEKAMKIALIHDLGEAVIGDITPHDAVSADEKYAKEEKAVTEIFSSVEGGAEFVVLWREFESKSSPEARLVAQLDKLDAFLQSKHYELPKEALDEFLASAQNNIEDTELLNQILEIDSKSKNRPEGR